MICPQRPRGGPAILHDAMADKILPITTEQNIPLTLFAQAKACLPGVHDLEVTTPTTPVRRLGPRDRVSIHATQESITGVAVGVNA